MKRILSPSFLLVLSLVWMKEIEMEKEANNAMWERIQALENENLQTSQKLSEASMVSVIAKLRAELAETGKFEEFTAFIEPRTAEFRRQIAAAQSVEEVMRVTDRFKEDCAAFARSLEG
jgi:hypothetical protein